MILNLKFGLCESKIICFAIIVEPKMQSLIKLAESDFREIVQPQPNLGKFFGQLGEKYGNTAGGSKSPEFLINILTAFANTNKIHVKEENLEILVLI